MKKKLRPFANRLTRRIFWATLLTNGIIFFLVYLVAQSGMSYLTRGHYQEIMDFMGERVESVLSTVEVSAVNNVSEIDDHLSSPEDVFYALEKELNLNKHLVGCAVAFEPDFFPSQGRWFEPYAQFNDSGEIKLSQIGSAEHDYHQSKWYRTCIEKKEPSWSEPYFDEAGANMMLLSYSIPIVDKQGHTAGIYAADVSIEWLTEQVRDIDRREAQSTHVLDSTRREYAPFSFIISRKGEYIVHPDSHRILRKNFLDEMALTEDDADDSVAVSMINGKKGYAKIVLDSIPSFIFYSPLKQTGWSMAIVVPVFTINFVGMIISFFILALLGIGTLAAMIISRSTIRKATKPLTKLADSASEVAHGNFDTSLPRIKHNDEIRLLRDTFEEMQVSLSQYVDELKDTTAQKASMERELKIAHGIQEAMLPKTFPPYPDRHDIDIFGALYPAKAVSGDLYDFYLRDEKLFFCIGDVAGKGIPASLVMAVTRSLFRNISTHATEPNRIVTALNEAVNDNNDSNMFVTMFVGILDLPTGRLRYCNAGHNAPLLMKPDGVEMLPCDSNIPVGVLPDWKYTLQHTILDPGCGIFLYTDGLTEAENIEHNLFGQERLLETATNASRTPKELIGTMTEAAHQFVGEAEQSDDLTMLSIQYTKQLLDIRYKKHVSLSNDVKDIARLATFVDHVCEAMGFDMSTTMQMNLAMEEAVVNVMNYAYPPGIKGNIDIDAEANDLRLKFIISDSGTPFDPTTKEDVDTSLSAEERAIGGLGIHLVRSIMDSINYEYVDGMNVLTLRKNLTKDE